MPIEDLGDGVIGFDSMEEFFGWQVVKEAEANARVQDWQRELRPGDLVARITTHHKPIIILGKTITPDEHYADMLHRYADQEDIEAEATYERSSIFERFERGYLYGKWYSLIEPEGEYGDAHISTLMPKVPSEIWEHWLEMIQLGIDPLIEITGILQEVRHGVPGEPNPDREGPGQAE